MKHNSAARDFYLYLLHNPTDCKDILTHRARSICNKYQLNIYKYLLNDTYAAKCKADMLQYPKENDNGLIDTLRVLLSNIDKENMSLLRLLLKSY